MRTAGGEISPRCFAVEHLLVVCARPGGAARYRSRGGPPRTPALPLDRPTAITRTSQGSDATSRDTSGDHRSANVPDLGKRGLLDGEPPRQAVEAIHDKPANRAILHRSESVVQTQTHIQSARATHSLVTRRHHDAVNVVARPPADRT